MDVTFQPVSAAELPAYARATSIGFQESPTWLDEHQGWAALDLDRTLVGIDGDDIVATSRNYSLELTVPGGAILPAAGVSAVTVRPTHRRRGLLRSMMVRLLDEAVEHGEPVAMLTASEASIYRRFGFGISTQSMTIEGSSTSTRPASSNPRCSRGCARRIPARCRDRTRGGAMSSGSRASVSGST